MLDSKTLHISLKRGKGITEMVEKYKLNNEEELFQIIRRLIPNKAERFIAKFQENQRKLDKKTAMSKKTKGIEKTPSPEIVPETQSSINLQFDETTSKVIGKKSNMEELKALLAQEDELSKLCVEMEKKHKDMCSERREIVDKLRQAQKALRELEKILGLQQENVKYLTQKYQELAMQMRKTSEEISAGKQILLDIRKEIAELRIVNVLFYADGHIEVENGEVLTVGEEKILEGFDKLLSVSESDGFTIRVLKGLVKLHELVKYYENQHIRYEILFDDLKAEGFWKTVSSDHLLD